MGDKVNVKKRVLIVDDEPKIVKIISLKLRLAGYEVTSSTNSLEVVERIRYQKPDIVLLDIIMPGMDGYEVLQRVRSFSMVPIIIFTARHEGIEKAMRLGANDSISKPFNPDQLVEKINILLANDTSVII